jgi:HTH-type transcriptional regulator / antitoxin HigA
VFNKTSGKMTVGLPKSDPYLDLLHRHPPRPITDEVALAAAQAVVDELLDLGQLTLDQQGYLNVLAALIYEYEQTLEPFPDITGVDLLKELIVEHNLRQKDLLSIFKTESIISDVLHGKRNLTVAHIQGLAEFFHVSPACFFSDSRSTSKLC